MAAHEKTTPRITTPLLTIDAHGRIGQANGPFLAGWGYSCIEELIGRSLTAVLSPITDTDQTCLERLLRQEAWQGRLRARHLDGSTPPIWCWLERLLGAPGQAPGYVVRFECLRAADDASAAASEGTGFLADEHADEAALNRNERRLERAHAMAGIGTLEVDLISGEVTCSAQAKRILETAWDGNALGLDALSARLHSDDRAAFNDALRQAHAVGSPPELRLRAPMADGGVKWLALWIVVDQDDAGQAWRCIVALQDISQQHRREAQLLRFKSMVEHATQEVWMTDSDRRVRYVNPAGAASLGHAPDALLGRRLDEIDAGGAEFIETASRAVARQHDDGTGIQPFEVEHRHQDGRIVPKEIHPTLALIDGEWLHLCFAHDISERKRLLEVLAASRADMHATLSAFPGWVVCVDESHRYRYVNEAYCQYAGRPHDQIIGRTISEVRGADVAAAKQAITGRLRAGKIVTDEHRHLDASGRETIYWRQYLAASDAARPGQRFFYGFGTNITDSRRTQWRLSTVVERMGIGVWEWHATSGKITVNEQLPGLVGLDRDGLSERPAEWIGTFVHPDDQPSRRQQIRRVMAGELKTFDSEFRARHQGGHWIWLLERGQVASSSASGRPLAVIGTVQDITALKQHEAALQRLNSELEARVEQRTRELQEARAQAEMASAAKSEFLSLMSHELRTPLNAIVGFGQLLQLSKLPHEDAQHVREMMNAGRHLTNLIDEVLDLATVESGRMRLITEVFDIDEMTHECIAMLSSAARDAGLRIEQHSAGAHHHVRADRGRLKQVLLNLLSNAIKYNRRGGRVAVDCDLDASGQLQIAVSDSGWGMTGQQIERLFQPFERLDATHSAVQGTGIGLALSKRLVEMMGGTIGVESDPGRGSTFWVRLPALASSPQQAPVPVSEPPAHPRAEARWESDRAIVYVEDNLPNQRLMQRILSLRDGLSLTCVAEPMVALAHIQREPPALVLLDLQLPHIDGYQLLASLRSAGARMPIVAVTAQAMLDDLARGVEAGFDAYLTKPLNVVHVLDTIDRLLGASTAVAD